MEKSQPEHGRYWSESENLAQLQEYVGRALRRHMDAILSSEGEPLAQSSVAEHAAMAANEAAKWVLLRHGELIYEVAAGAHAELASRERAKAETFLPYQWLQLMRDNVNSILRLQKLIYRAEAGVPPEPAEYDDMRLTNLRAGAARLSIAQKFAGLEHPPEEKVAARLAEAASKAVAEFPLGELITRQDDPARP